MSDHGQRLLDYLQKFEQGVADKVLNDAFPEWTGEQLIAAINALSESNQIELLLAAAGTEGQAPQLVYRAVQVSEVTKQQQMTGEERVIYQYIRASGNEGLWTKLIKQKTGLHALVVQRCLKQLEHRGLIKSVKSIQNPTRKLYMLTEYQPSVEVTGGPWYTDQELDQDFVETILQHCLRYIQSRSFPKSVNSNAIDKTLYSSSYVGYPSAIDVKNYITRSSIANVELGLENINTLLKVLEFDGKIERLASDLTKRDVKMAIDSDSDSGDDEESWVFKALPTSFTTAPSTTTTSTSTITAFAWTDTPCGHCPVIIWQSTNQQRGRCLTFAQKRGPFLPIRANIISAG